MTDSLDQTRRKVMKYSALGLVGSALMSRTDKVAAMQTATSPTSPNSVTGKLKAGYKKHSEALLLPRHYGGKDQPPAPATYDMLSTDWHRRQMNLLFAMAAERGVQAVLLRQPVNVQYFTGYWYRSTERPQVAFMNKDDQAPWYFHPVIDNQLVRAGWFGGEKIYFDFPHAPGGFPNEGKVVTAPGVDMMEFMLEGVRDKGVQGTKIGIDGELYPSELAKLKKVMPNIEPVNIADLIRDIRITKTPEELALWSRAYTYTDRGHAFARDYLLTYGTDITDLELQLATELWLSDTLYQDLDLAGGLMNRGVGSAVHAAVRAGRTNSYPHPNQPYYSRILKNQPLQIIAVAMIGNCGGENYRMFQIADQAGKFDAHGTKMWEVTQHCCDIQRDMQKEGAVCGDIAYAIHKYQVDEGMQKYIYHRPGHGEASEGHYPPYIALGDRTVLKQNSVFSEEPGLYDPEGGVGYNWSDNIVTGKDTGYRMSFVPYTKEWSFVKL
ncbi:M24 family metallopeptidase [Sphingomonas nostoxanthinifaciens]|uniref:M24 family metallopeptidase n=1 Tax=Sphingomonas nostoxanthinifaciens TaxID=2872652 RepID=UPI001CC1F941|nr:M24 family metallopeptidase [Sphingomonas nostoxanthinifaciens]UAK22923.1 M24 family metallopeptidase [Sphingomonas nostoxanthinifaciens]